MIRKLLLTLVLTLAPSTSCWKIPMDCPGPSKCSTCFTDGPFDYELFQPKQEIERSVGDLQVTYDVLGTNWSYSGTTTDLLKSATFSAYYESRGSDYLPLSTCCNVPLSQKSCVINAVDLNKIFYSVQVNGSVAMYSNAAWCRECVQKRTEEYVYVCAAKNDRDCVAIDKSSGEIREVVFLRSTSTFQNNKFVVANSFAGCTYEVKKDLIDKNKKLRVSSAVSSVFNRTIWNATSYSGVFDKGGQCRNAHDFNVDRSNYNVTPGHYLCFKYNAVGSQFYYCMDHDETGVERKTEEPAPSVILVVVLVSVSVLLLLMMILFCAVRLRRRARDFWKDSKKIPVTLEAAERGWDENGTEKQCVENKEMADLIVYRQPDKTKNNDPRLQYDQTVQIGLTGNDPRNSNFNDNRSGYLLRSNSSDEVSDSAFYSGKALSSGSSGIGNSFESYKETNAASEIADQGSDSDSEFESGKTSGYNDSRFSRPSSHDTGYSKSVSSRNSSTASCNEDKCPASESHNDVFITPEPRAEKELAFEKTKNLPDPSLVFKAIFAKQMTQQQQQQQATPEAEAKSAAAGGERSAYWSK